MTYRETLDYLFSSLPMFQRIGDAAIRKDLTNIRLLSRMLNQPEAAFTTLHVAGTNGKGSTSHMLAAIFQAAGKKTGLYTSPHYVDFRERIRVNGKMIPEREVVDFVASFKDQWTDFRPSFFEITVAMAFDYFRKSNVDIAIIETGLGGRLDSTNIITPYMSVITNIGFDHMNILGHTLPEIAFEKAGIIKDQIPVVVGEWHQETAEVFQKKAVSVKAPLYFASRHLTVKRIGADWNRQHFSVALRSRMWFEDITCDLAGPYQLQNIRTVLEAVFRWNQHYPQHALSDKVIRKGLASVKTYTGMLGRWMVIRRNPLVITDAAHNQHGMKAMLPDLLRQPAHQRHFVLGFVSDKEVKKVLSLFPRDGKYYWCAPDIPRAKQPEDVKQAGAELGLQGNVFGSVRQAYQAAIQAADKSDLVFVGGSSYVVGDFLAAIETQGPKK